jgi:hypothetical protein
MLPLRIDGTRPGSRRRMNALKAGSAKPGVVAEPPWLQR